MRFATQHIVTSQNDWQQRLQSFDKAQLSFQNTTLVNQKLTLWGANEVATTLPESSYINTGNSPQAIAYNSFNGLLYVVNQLESSVTVFSPGEINGRTIVLEEQLLFASPLDIAINQVDGSAYIIGSLSNKLYHIDTNLSVKQAIELDNRPISIAIHPVNSQLYISHLLSKQVTVVGLDSFSIEQRIVVDDVTTQIITNELNGDWMALQPESNTIQVFDKQNTLKINLTEIGLRPSKAVLYSAENSLYVIAADSSELLIISLNEFKITSRITLENKPIALAIDAKEKLFVGFENSSTLSTYSKELDFVDYLEVTTVHSAWYLDTENELLYIPNPIQNKIEIERLEAQEGNEIVTTSDYKELAREFQFKPARLEHVKVQFSGRAIAPIFRIGTDSTRGKVSSRIISLCKFTSPQHFAAIFEVSDFKDEIINGNSFWEVIIPPEQHLSLLLYYKQAA